MTTWHQDFFTAVERWPWLATLNESVSGVVQPVYDRFRGNLAVELLHGGRWAGHALHPALSDLPIGFWSSSLLLDMVSQDNAADSRRWGPAATLSAAGLASAVATATTGVADWTVSDGEDRRVGLFHGLLNGAAMVLQGASLAARLAGRRTPALGLSAAGMAAVAAAGFVGGHLVQGRGAMVNRVAANTGPTRWVKAVAEDDLTDGESKGVDVEGRKVLLYRDHGTVYAIDDVCTHAGALLSRGPVVDCVVTCPLHESQFDVRDGRIVRGPAHHPQPALPARVRNGWVEVRGSQPVKRRAKT
ncbi:MAG: non-heme iron oxygenase ferredoxin subunit [Pseudonocardiales bacterium]|nr:non-heme iron oxygenase ferredoxin subunit [Pseudonocardiales bacterium]